MVFDPFSDYSQRVSNDVMIEQVRSFNRTVTQRVGALNDAFLARRRSLGQSRVLWEIGPERCDVRRLRALLELDSGYLSRLLRALEDAGLAVVEPSKEDGRVRTARLTAAGLAERQELDLRSDAAAASMLRPLSSKQRTRLVAAMAEVEHLLIASAVQVSLADPRDPAARRCMAAYFAELSERFDAGFNPGQSISADDAELTPPAGLLLLATLRGEAVGIGALKLHGEGPAEIKRMWVSRAARELGVGRRLLAELEDRAVERGVGVVRLETNRALGEAIGLYRSAGYSEVPAFNRETYAHHWFEKELS